jgi:hypothetical protein
MRAGKLMGEIVAVERDGEEKAQRRSLVVQLGRLSSLLDLMQLELSDIIPGRGIGRASEECGEDLDLVEIGTLGLVVQRADGHVRDHRRRRSLMGLSRIGGS